MLPYEHGAEDEEGGDSRRRGGLVKPVEGRPHQEGCGDAAQLPGDAEPEKDVDREIARVHQVQRPRNRAKTRPPIRDATAEITATVK